MNLNEMQVTTDGGFEPVKDNSTKAGNVEVYFRNIEEELVKKIRAHDISLGCVAWLTSAPILKELANTEAQVIVQKEDFLRPDVGARPHTWKAWLRRMYSRIEFNIDRYAFPYLGGFSYAGDPGMEGVRCVGNHNRDRNPAFPRMHNKFMVFGRLETRSGVNHGERFEYERVVPEAVWTGSFNFTRNAGMSLENALYITEPSIVEAYFNEYQQIAALSEPLNWSSDWCAPEWRLGT